MSRRKIDYLTSPVLRPYGWLIHGFGLASGSCDRPDAYPADGLKPVLPKQIHSDEVHVLDRVPLEKPVGDALVSAVAGLLLVVRTADCLPVLLAEPGARVVAAVHCGWRGTAAGILKKTLLVMKSEFATRPQDVRAALGPSIAGSCYEVGEDVRQAFAAAGFPDGVFRAAAGRPGKYLLDLVRANAGLLVEAGVMPDNISLAGICSHCRPEFYSYRRDKGEKRRMCNFIGLRPA